MVEHCPKILASEEKAISKYLGAISTGESATRKFPACITTWVLLAQVNKPPGSFQHA